MPAHQLFISTVLALGAGVAAGAAAGDREADRAAIRAHIDAIFEAYRQKDRATVRATHAAEWRGFIRASRSVVRGIDEYMRQAEGVLGSPAVFSNYKMVEFDVLFRGDMAIVSYVASLDWSVDGVTHPDKLRVLDIYAREGRGWNQIASHVASHPDAVDAERQQPRVLSPTERTELLAAREGVWRAWFRGDEAALRGSVPDDVVAIDAAEERWSTRSEILTSAQEFAASGARLVSLEFPRTEIRVYGDVAVLYTRYRAETERDGKRNVLEGRGTEVFVRRAGRWVNSGWHLDSGR